MPFVGSVEAKMAFGRPTATSSNVVTSNLQIWLDSGNNSSYTGSGTTWTNLVSGNAPTYNFTLTAPTSSNITYNGTTNRSIYFNGSTSYTINNTSLLTLAQANNWQETREFWIYWPGTAGCLISELGQATVNTGWTDAQASISGSNLVYSVWQGSLTPYVVTTSFVANRWNHVVWQHNKGTNTLSAYLNGVQIYNNTNVSRTTPDSISAQFFLALCQGNITNFGYGSGSQLAASIAVFRWYNTILTSNQISSNFQSERARFGV